LKDSLDFHGGSAGNSWQIVLSPAMQRDIFRMYDEIEQLSCRKNAETVIDLHNFITVVLERIELHNEYRMFMFGNIKTEAIVVGGGSVTP
jgi:hypothetical protein